MFSKNPGAVFGPSAQNRSNKAKIDSQKALSSGADPDTSVAEENDTLSVVHLASRANNYSILSLLIAYGASIELATRHYWTALHLAAHSGHVETIKLLLKYKACIDVQDCG